MSGIGKFIGRRRGWNKAPDRPSVSYFVAWAGVFLVLGVVMSWLAVEEDSFARFLFIGSAACFLGLAIAGIIAVAKVKKDPEKAYSNLDKARGKGSSGSSTQRD